MISSRFIHLLKTLFIVTEFLLLCGCLSSQNFFSKKFSVIEDDDYITFSSDAYNFKHDAYNDVKIQIAERGLLIVKGSSIETDIRLFENKNDIINKEMLEKRYSHFLSNSFFQTLALPPPEWKKIDEGWICTIRIEKKHFKEMTNSLKDCLSGLMSNIQDFSNEEKFVINNSLKDITSTYNSLISELMLFGYDQAYDMTHKINRTPIAELNKSMNHYFNSLLFAIGTDGKVNISLSCTSDIFINGKESIIPVLMKVSVFTGHVKKEEEYSIEVIVNDPPKIIQSNLLTIPGKHIIEVVLDVEKIKLNKAYIDILQIPKNTIQFTIQKSSREFFLTSLGDDTYTTLSYAKLENVLSHFFSESDFVNRKNAKEKEALGFYLKDISASEKKDWAGFYTKSIEFGWIDSKGFEHAILYQKGIDIDLTRALQKAVNNVADALSIDPLLICELISKNY